MKIYQLVNDGGYPASVMEDDLALFATREQAQSAFDYFQSETNNFDGVTIREVTRMEDIAMIKPDPMPEVVVDCWHNPADDTRYYALHESCGSTVESGFETEEEAKKWAAENGYKVVDLFNITSNDKL